MSHEIFELLRADNTIYANRTLAGAIGLNEAVIYSALLGKAHYYRSNGQLDSEDMFYATAADLEEKTTLTQRQQDRAVSHLEEYGLIETQVKGLPARKYFRINPDAEIVLKLMRDKPKGKPGKGGDSGSGSKSSENEPDSSSEKESDTAETGGETSFDKMSKLESTEAQNQFQQNVETGINKTSKPVLTKSENKNQQNSEAINISNNKYIYNKNNNYNTRARGKPDGEQYEYKNKKSYVENKNQGKQADNNITQPETADNNFVGLIDRFTANEKVRTALREYVNMRQKRPKTATTEYIIELALKRLSELSGDPETQVKILEQSILNSYPDLYGLKEKDTKKRSENNDNSGDYRSNGNSSRTDGVYYTGMAGGKTESGRYGSLSGVVRLG